MSKEKMNYEDLENLINEGFKDAIKQAAKAAVDRSRQSRGARSKYGTTGKILQNFAAGWKGVEAPKAGIFQGQTDPREYNKGLVEITEFYKKASYDNPAMEQKKSEIVGVLEKAQRDIQELMNAGNSQPQQQPQQQPDQQPDQQQGSEQEPENNA
jgi:hypothetical protein